MIPQESKLVVLVKMIDLIPRPAVGPAKRGHPILYSEKLFLKALLIMIVKHLHKVHELLSGLNEPTYEMQQLRDLLTENGCYPARRTWERRLKGFPEYLPAQIGCFGRYLIELIAPWADCGRAVAIDSTVLRSNGGVWHKKDREKGEVPHTSIDTEAHWKINDEIDSTKDRNKERHEQPWICCKCGQPITQCDCPAKKQPVPCKNLIQNGCL